MILASGFASCDYFGQKIIPDEGVSNIIEIDSFTTIVAGSFVSAPKKEITEVEIVPISDQTYTGKAIKPKVTAKQDGRKLTEGKDYQITYQNNKNIGKATVILTGKGDYTGEIMADFHIVPKTVTLSALKSIKSNQLTVKWKKGSGITGYEIQYSLKKNFKNAEAITIDKAKTTSVTIPELKSRKKYYVRIRAYKTVNGENYYSEWSKAMNQKVK